MVKWSVKGQWNKVVNGAAMESNLENIEGTQHEVCLKILGYFTKNYDCSITVDSE